MTNTVKKGTDRTRAEPCQRSDWWPMFTAETTPSSVLPPCIIQIHLKPRKRIISKMSPVDHVRCTIRIIHTHPCYPGMYLECILITTAPPQSEPTGPKRFGENDKTKETGTAKDHPKIIPTREIQKKTPPTSTCFNVLS